MNPEQNTPVLVANRDGDIVPFDSKRIEHAVLGAFRACAEPVTTSAEFVAFEVEREMQRSYPNAFYWQVTAIEQAVIKVLGQLGEVEAQSRYQAYRQRHAEERALAPIPEEVKLAFEESAQYFPTQLQQFQFYDKYARFDYEKGRRETWVETVDRTVDFLRELSHNRLDASLYAEIRQAILRMDVMPSMRLLAMAGPAARRNNIALFNCSYSVVDCIDAFVEALIISMSGCGVGFSVERQYVNKLPKVEYQREGVTHYYRVPDSSEGWEQALRFGLESWFKGEDVDFDLRDIRPAGAPLKTKGGQASGPGPLREMLSEIRTVILKAQGRKLTPLEAHDIMCHVGQAAVQGGVRRTAMISIFSQDDYEMLNCKHPDNCHSTDMKYLNEHGEWVNYPTNLNTQRWNANNSVKWKELPTREQVEWQFNAMFESFSGEPGIFNEYNARKYRPKHREDAEFGTNPLTLAA